MVDKKNSPPELPSGLALAWGVTDRPRRGPKPGLTLERIVRRGVELADAEGLSALSMSRLANLLGFTTMSLYRYVASKDDLLVLIHDAAVGAPPPMQAVGWREGLAAWCRAQLAVLRTHPWMVRIPISGPPMNPNSVAWIESGLAAMTGSGLTEAEKMAVIQLLAGYVLHQARLEAEIMAAYAAAGVPDPVGVAQDYGRVLAGLIDAERFPALSETLAAGVFAGADEDWDVDVEFGLNRILDGIGVLVAGRTG